MGPSTRTAARCSVTSTFLERVTLLLVKKSVLFQWRFTERVFFLRAVIDGQQERERINEQSNYSPSWKQERFLTQRQLWKTRLKCLGDKFLKLQVMEDIKCIYSNSQGTCTFYSAEECNTPLLVTELKGCPKKSNLTKRL